MAWDLYSCLVPIYFFFGSRCYFFHNLAHTAGTSCLRMQYIFIANVASIHMKKKINNQHARLKGLYIVQEQV